MEEHQQALFEIEEKQASVQMQANVSHRNHCRKCFGDVEKERGLR